MSLFRDEQPQLAGLILDSRSANASPVGGEFWKDKAQNGLLFQHNQQTTAIPLQVTQNVTAVTASNPSSAANLMAGPAFIAGALNAVGKTIEFYGAGYYVTASGQTPTITFALNLGSTALISIVTAATTASTTGSPWNLHGYAVVQTAGSSGVLEAHAVLNLTLGTNAAVAAAGYNDTNIAVSSTVDLTVSEALQLTGLMSTSNAGNSIVQRLFVVKVSN